MGGAGDMAGAGANGVKGRGRPVLPREDSADWLPHSLPRKHYSAFGAVFLEPASI